MIAHKINRNQAKMSGSKLWSGISSLLILSLLLLASLTISASAAPVITLQKIAVTVIPETPHEGSVINYTYIVTNDGDDDASDFKIYDYRNYPAPSGSNAVIDLGTVPGKSIRRYTEFYTITEADCCKGSLLNQAKAYWTWNSNTYYSANRTATVAISTQTSIKLDKSSSSNPFSYAHVGDTVIYNYTVKNMGEITVRGIRVVDTPLGVVALNTTVLAPGKVAGGTISKTIINSDYPEFSNSAIANATSVTFPN